MSDDSSNTTPQQRKVPGRPFVKGDKRINRKGRPVKFDEARALAQLIAIEPIGEGAQRMTVIEAIFRRWATSKDPRLQIAFVEFAYGKVPQRAEVTGVDGVPIRFIIEKDADAANE